MTPKTIGELLGMTEIIPVLTQEGARKLVSGEFDLAALNRKLNETGGVEQ